MRRFVRNDQLILGVLAVVVGSVCGAAIVGFRELIALVQTVAYGEGHDYLATIARGHSALWVILIPTLGGLVVGLFYHLALRAHGPQGVAHVMEAVALKGGRISARLGALAAAGSALSIGVGASVGREGPAVHLGAALSSWIARKLRFGKRLARTLLGCGAAAAVAASFNAPIAGALFANEVVIGHYALSAFAPVVVASVSGTLVSRYWFGDFPAFVLPPMELISFWEFPAFAGLGVASGIMALVFMKSIFVAQEAGAASRLPMPLRTGLAGFVTGLAAVWLPEVLGVGYEVTDSALKNVLPLTFLIVLIPVKLAVTAICLGWGFGGGVFSPSLTLGALLGAAYGLVATAIFPELSSGTSAYALIGMGATAAAVLGAPISTTLIIFELTGDYELTIGVVVAVVIATAITQNAVGEASFFHWQLGRRGLRLRGAQDEQLLRTLKVADVPYGSCPTVAEDAGPGAVLAALHDVPFGELYVVDTAGRLVGTLTLAEVDPRWLKTEASADCPVAGAFCRRAPPMLTLDDSLETAMGMMQTRGEEHVAIVDGTESRRPVGCLHEKDVLWAYNRAMIAARAETV